MIIVKIDEPHWSTSPRMSLSNSLSNLFHFHLHSLSPPSSPAQSFLADDNLSRPSPISLQKGSLPLFHVTVKPRLEINCVAKSTEESERGESGELIGAVDDGDRVEELSGGGSGQVQESLGVASSTRVVAGVSSDSLSLGIREPVYEVVEVKCDGTISTRKISRRHLLKTSGLRPRDIRSVDPSLWLTNTMPSLLGLHKLPLRNIGHGYVRWKQPLWKCGKVAYTRPPCNVREHAILLNLGSLRAIAMEEGVFIFNYERKGGKAFIDALLPRLNPKNTNGGLAMPFELEVVEAALHSRIQRLELRLMDLEPRVRSLLEVLPNRLTANILEELRISKQTLVELGSKAGALKQMLLDILEDSDEIQRICIIGRNCALKRGDDVECSVPLEKHIAEEEEEEIEMLLENYLQRCESCHGQAERLLDSAREMEDSIAVNLSSRRLEVSRVELLLQVGAFCAAIGALVTGIFGMNLKSYLEEKALAFWTITAGIIVGGVVAFFLMYTYLRKRKIL